MKDSLVIRARSCPSASPIFCRRPIAATVSDSLEDLMACMPHLIPFGARRAPNAAGAFCLEAGKTYICGSSPTADIPVAGVAIDDVHCLFHCIGGDVYLQPKSNLCQLNGKMISNKVRLDDGCLVCLGLHSYFRFNNPLQTARPFASKKSAESTLQKDTDRKTRLKNHGAHVSASSSSSSSSSLQLSETNGCTGVVNYGINGKPSDLSCSPAGCSLLPDNSPDNQHSQEETKEKRPAPTTTTVDDHQSRPKKYTKSKSSAAVLDSEQHPNGGRAPRAVLDGEFRIRFLKPVAQSRIKAFFSKPAGPLAVSKSANSTPKKSSLPALSLPLKSFKKHQNRSSPTTIASPPPLHDINNGEMSEKTPAKNLSNNDTIADDQSQTSVVDQDSSVPAVGSASAVAEQLDSSVLDDDADDGPFMDEAHRQLVIKLNQKRRERLEEQRIAELERKRLDEILLLCAEFGSDGSVNLQDFTTTGDSSKATTDGPPDSTSEATDTVAKSSGRQRQVFQEQRTLRDSLSDSGRSLSASARSLPGKFSPFPVSMQHRSSEPADQPTESPLSSTSPSSTEKPTGFGILVESDKTTGTESENNAEDSSRMTGNYDNIDNLTPLLNGSLKLDSTGLCSSSADSGNGSPRVLSSHSSSFPAQSASPSDDQSGQRQQNVSSDGDTGVDGVSPSSNLSSPTERYINDVLTAYVDFRHLEALDRFTQLTYLFSVKQRILETITELNQQILDMESQEQDALQELDQQRAQLESEYSTQVSKMCAQQQCLNMLKQRQLQLTREGQAEREKLNRSIELENRRLVGLKQETVQLENDLNTNPPTTGQAIGSVAELEQLNAASAGDIDVRLLQYARLKEGLDYQQKRLEDLEFQQMELESQYEEVYELLEQQIIQQESELLRLFRQKEERLKHIDRQQRQLIRRVRSNLDFMERQRKRLVSQLGREQQALKAVEMKVKIVKGEDPCHLSNGNEQDAAESARNDLTDVTAASMEDEDEQWTLNQYHRLQLLDQQLAEIVRQARAALQRLRQDTVATLSPGDTAVAGQGVHDLSATDSMDDSASAVNAKTVNGTSGPSSETTSPQTSVGLNGATVSNSNEDAKTTSSVDEECYEKIRELEQILHQTGNDLPGTKAAARDSSKSSHHSSSVPQSSEERDSLGSIGQVQLRKKDSGSAISGGQQQRPMTRYLPAKGPEFDLVQHLEHAGHDLDSCKHVTVTPTACRGYLQKMGAKLGFSSKRWFVLDRQRRALVYYSDRTEQGRPRGIFYFQAICEVFMDHRKSSRSPNPSSTFCLKTHERLIYLAAPNGASMRIWMDAIFSCAEGYREYEMR